MAYTPRPFDYSLRPYDALDLSAETADILDVRDGQLTNYLRTETASIKAETDSLSSSIGSIVSAPGDWDTSFVPTLRRGTTTVATTVTSSAYCQNAYLVFFKCELFVTSTSTWSATQRAEISLPVTASSTTRMLGTGMYLQNTAPSFYVFRAFIESTSANSDRAVFIVDRGVDWLGQSGASYPGNPVITGSRYADVWYLDLCYRPA